MAFLPLVRLSMVRALRTPLARVGQVGTVVLLLVGLGILALLRHSHRAPLDETFALASDLFAWCGGGTISVGASLSLYERDRREGFMSFAAVHGFGGPAYFWARALGVLFVVSVVVSLAIVVFAAVAMGLFGISRVLRPFLGALLFGGVFACVTTPVTLFALSGRSRLLGYALLVLLLSFPAWILAPFLPNGSRFSVVGALSLVRDAVARGRGEGIGIAAVVLFVTTVIFALGSLWEAQKRFHEACK